MSKSVGLYCDVSNLYYCVKSKYDGAKIDYAKLKDFSSAYGRIDKAVAYGAQVGRQAQKFITCLENSGYRADYKEPKTYNKGTSKQQSKANHDVSITVDIVTDSEELDIIILGSADGDFAPLVEYLLMKGKDVVVIGCGISHELQIATQCIELPPMVLL